MNWHIYVLLDPLSNLVRYVGKTKNVKNRLVKHMCPSKLKASNHKNNWIKNLLKNKLKPNLLIIETCSSEDEVNELEIFYIDYLRFLGFDLVNTASGGMGGNTGSPSPEHLEKLRIINSKSKTEEHKRKISDAHKGMIASNETKMKISLSKIGEKSPTAKLNNKKVLEIKRLLQQGSLIKDIAKMFSVGRRTISNIKAGHSWGHIKIGDDLC